MEFGKAKTIRIIATSDLHGKFLPQNYDTGKEELSGSMAQICTAAKELRDENTLVIDAGDTFQGNSAELFINEPIHPMAQCMNMIGYDFWVTGNHDYDYGDQTLSRIIRSLNAKTLTGNVRHADGTPLADRYAVIEKNGIRIGLIGMTTLVIDEEYAVQRDGMIVEDPLKKTREIIDCIKEDVDVLIGIFHMGLGHSINDRDTSVMDMTDCCPEFDVIIASHEHKIMESYYSRRTLIIENAEQGKTLTMISLSFEDYDGRYKLTDKHAKTIYMKEYDPDPAVMHAMKGYDRAARKDAETEIGILSGVPLAGRPAYGIPDPLLHSTPLMNLIHQILRYYSGAAVTAVNLTNAEANLQPGMIFKFSAGSLMRFPNYLSLLRMTKDQLKKYMEWSASYFLTCSSEDDIIRTDPEKPMFMYDIFGGLHYEIDVSQEPFSRIRSMTFPDGTPVTENDVLTVAVTEYRAIHFLLNEDGLFKGEQPPELLKKRLHPEIGEIQKMVVKYIQEVKKGKIESDSTVFWRVSRF